MKINSYYSPNFNTKKRPFNSIKIIVIHYTGMQSQRESIKRLCNPKFKVSCHLLIGANGRIFRLVEDNKIAWHAGISCWGKYKNLNNNSIGIELVSRGHRYGYTNFRKEQIVSLVKICRSLIIKYKIKKNNITGHSDIAPLRKKDPGEKFPWFVLANKKIGIWHHCNSTFLKKHRKIGGLVKKDKIDFFKNLKKIGYCFSSGTKINSVKIIRAFQRHFRKELVNGILDKECSIIAKDLSKRL